MNTKKYLLTIWTVFIFVLLVIPMPIDDSGQFSEGIFDKVVHFFLFGIFSSLVIYNLSAEKRTIVFFLISALIGIFYSALGEHIQSFLPSRTNSFIDFFAGVSGVLFFVAFYYVKNRKF
jgi:VanZ family protein